MEVDIKMESKIDLKSQLGQELKRMYDKAPRNEQVTMVHLFGIKNGETIVSNGLKASDIVQEAGINDSYKTEVSKGIKLAAYVDIKTGVILP